MPKISIVIPAYNEEKYIAQFLKQFKDSKEKYDLELIVADDHSTDNTVEIAKKYADKVTVLDKRENISVVRNAGAKLATGEFMIEADTDTRIKDPDHFFEKVLEIFKDPKVIAITPSLYIYPEEETFFDRIFHSFINLIVMLMSPFGSNRGPAQIMRTEAFWKAGGYDETLVVTEDMELFKRLKKLGKIVYRNDLVAYESPRRYRKEGHIKVVILWLLNYFGMLFFKKSYSKKW